VQLFVDQFVSITGQTGGVSAHTIHAKTINVQPSAADAATQQRRVQAIDALWKIVRSCRNEFSDIVFVDTILTKQEIENYFMNGWDSKWASINEYASEQTLLEKMNKTKAGDVEDERPFVSHRLYVIVFTIRAVLGRVAFLFKKSFDEKRYNDWRTDSRMDQLFRCVLPANIVEEVKKEQVFGLQRAIDHLENEFVTWAQLNGERIQFDTQ